MEPIELSCLALLLLACNPNDAGPGQPKAAFYAGPGSEWTAQVNPDSTSMLLHFPTTGSVAADRLVDASDVTTDGITTLTVTSSAGVAAAPEGSTGMAVEQPGMLYTVAFADTTSPIVMVEGQVCPAGALSASFIKLKGAGASDVAGTFTYDPRDGIAAEASRYDVTGAPFGELLALGAGPCALGVATLDSTDELFVGQHGVALLHTMPALEAAGGDEVELALAQPDAAVTPASFAGSYAGTLFDGTTDRVIVATIATGSGEISTANGTRVGTLALTSSGPQPGLALGTMTLGTGPAGPAVCAIAASTPPLVACATRTEAGALASIVLAGQ